MTKKPADLARGWFNRELWGIEPRPEKHVTAFAKAVLICAQGDGCLSPAEQEWILGAYAARGASVELIDELRRYDAKEDLAQVLAGVGAGQAEARVVIYFAIQACAADGELHKLEMASIVKMGAMLGVSEDIVGKLADLYHEERALRDKRIKLVTSAGTTAA